MSHIAPTSRAAVVCLPVCLHPVIRADELETPVDRSHKLELVCPTRPINGTFGDPDMRTLYITGSGGVYKQRMMVSGPDPAPPTKV